MSVKKWLKKYFYQENQEEIHLDTELVDTNQSFWDLSVIQLTGLTSLPLLATSVLILRENSFFSALLTITLSNLILWVLRYAIVCMSFKGRKNTIELIQEYMGDPGRYILSIIIMLSTFAWFNGQTTIGINGIISLLHLKEGGPINFFIQGSIIMGVLSTLFCSGGIVWLKRLSLISFPILVISFICVLMTIPHKISGGTGNGISLYGMALALGSSLGVTADLPTFFRHSRSKAESIKALAVIQILSLIIGIGALYLGAVIDPWSGLNEIGNLTHGNPLLSISLFVLIFVSVICANVSNVYAGSVGWEVWAPKSLIGKKEYLLFGLGLTSFFIFFSNLFAIDIMLEKTDAALVNICLVLIIGYIIYLIRHKHPTSIEKYFYFFSWLMATSFSFSTHESEFIFETLIIAFVMSFGIIINKLYFKSLRI